MYVCLCNSITDKEIRAAVQSGARSFADVQDSLGVATCCGRCGDCARNVVASALAEHAPACAGGDD